MRKTRATAFLLALLARAAAASADPPEPEAPTPATDAVALDALETRYFTALDAAGWRRDDAPVRAVADDVTGEALAILERSPSLAPQARALLARAAGAPLGPWLRRAPRVDAVLAAPWLRDHDDPELARAVAALPPLVRLAVASYVASAQPRVAVELLRPRPPQLTAGVEVCDVALRMPAGARREVAAWAWQATGAEESPACVALLAERRELRGELRARTLAGFARVAATTAGPPLYVGLPSWTLTASALLAPSAPAAFAGPLRALAAQGTGGSAWTDAARELASVGPQVRIEDPAVAAMLDAAEASAPDVAGPLLPLRLRARSAARTRALLAAVEHPARPVTRWTARELVLTTPEGPPRARASAALLALRARLHAHSRDLTTQDLDAWLDALDRTAACADDACLRAVLRDGADEAAARAAWLLGPSGLASLPDDDAAALVRRVALDDTGDPGAQRASWLSLTVYTALRACPRSLRGLASLDLGVTYADEVSPWRTAFAGLCRDAGARGGR